MRHTLTQLSAEKSKKRRDQGKAIQQEQDLQHSDSEEDLPIRTSQAARRSGAANSSDSSDEN
jgi:hypothetical protein